MNRFSPILVCFATIYVSGALTKRAITFDEHCRIVQAELNPERKSYYELLWEIGAAQTDAANLSAVNVDWENRQLSFRRQKTGELCVMEIGQRLENLLKKLPATGPFFPKISQLPDRWRAAEFHRRCQILKIDGISLHSYRYAWAYYPLYYTVGHFSPDFGTYRRELSLSSNDLRSWLQRQGSNLQPAG